MSIYSPMNMSLPVESTFVLVEIKLLSGFGAQE